MGAFVGILVLLVFFGPTLLRVLSQLSRSSTGAGTYAPQSRIGRFEIRVHPDKLPGDRNLVVHGIEARGMFPAMFEVKASAITTVADVTDGTARPVFCFVEQWQEPTTPCFMFKTQLGSLSPQMGLRDWARIGAVFTDALQPPRGGQRRLKATLHLVRTAQLPVFVGGVPTGGQIPFWSESVEFVHEFTKPGYEEARERRLDAQELSIKLGVCVAMCDKDLADSEGQLLREWVSKVVTAQPKFKQEAIKKRFNDAMRGAFARMQSGELELTWLIHELNEIDDYASKYEAVELCYRVMAADGVAAADELRVIRHLSLIHI